VLAGNGLVRTLIVRKLGKGKKFELFSGTPGKAEKARAGKNIFR
jgi:hypothetical protein